MRFALRDDDTNFFTTAEQLQESYSFLWDIVPPSLFIITKVKGNWPKWVAHIYRHKQDSNWQEWENDNTIYPLHENETLIRFLRSKIKERKIDACFHAKHHRNSDNILPEAVHHNYVRCAEYYSAEDHTEAIKSELGYLQTLLDYKITVFAPPQDLLSHRGYQSVLQAGLNICGGGISFRKKQKSIKGILNLLKQCSFKTIFPDDPYPYVLDFKTHREIPYYFPLLPDTPLEHLIAKFEMVRRHDGDFVLSTHHAEFSYKMEHDSRRTLKDVLTEFMAHLSKYRISYVSMSELLSKNQPLQSFKSLYHLKKHQ